MMERNSGGYPPEGYKCFSCGSSGHFKYSNECRAKDAICSYCKKVGHYIEMCYKKQRDSAQRRDNHRSSTQNQIGPKRRLSMISISSNDESPKRREHQANKVDAAIAQPMASKQDPTTNIPIPVVSENGALHDCFIGNRSSRFKTNAANTINIISSTEYMRLLAAKFNLRTNEIQPMIVCNIEFKGIVTTHMKLTNGKLHYANFYIREGTEEFASITMELANKLKLS